jgi:N-acetylmuramoyl-L-alanine amidase
VSTIILDAGHGGVDPGAVGIDGLLEKDITLAISLRLKDHIERNSDIRVVLTRNDDTFIELKDRVAISNSTFPGWEKSALFISIHVNGSTSSSSSGYEVLVRESNKNAPFISTQSEDWAISYFSHTSFNQLRRSLNQASYAIAHSIRTAFFHSFPHSRDRGIKEMDVYVTNNNIWPSVLIEAGFITNQQEASLMKDPSWLDDLSQSIWEGILQYTL